MFDINKNNENPVSFFLENAIHSPIKEEIKEEGIKFEKKDIELNNQLKENNIIKPISPVQVIILNHRACRRACRLQYRRKFVRARLRAILKSNKASRNIGQELEKFNFEEKNEFEKKKEEKPSHRGRNQRRRERLAPLAVRYYLFIIIQHNW